MFLWILLEFTDNKLLSEIVGNRLEQTGDCSLPDEHKQPQKIIVFLMNVTTEQNSNSVS